MSERKQSGFTLIEVLIAMFIFSLISVGATSALTSSLRGKAQMNERLSAISEIESARAIMRSDFSQIQLRQTRDPYGGLTPYLLSGGIEDLINFTRSGRINPGGLEERSEFQRVTYLFEEGNLIRRTLNQNNPAPQTESRDRILLSDLQAADMTFLVAAQQQSVAAGASYDLAQDSFPKDTLLISPGQVTELPTRIMLELQFENGDELTQYFEVAL